MMPVLVHVGLVELDHVFEDAVDVGVASEAGGCGHGGEFGAEERGELGEAGGALEVSLGWGDGGEDGGEDRGAKFFWCKCEIVWKKRLVKGKVDISEYKMLRLIEY